MKLIHLSDLHLGKRVNEFSMLEDQRHILSQITAMVEAERPDAVLIAGDVFDKPTPSAEAVTLLDSFLVDLSSLACPVFLISGNHDSPERLAFGGRLMAGSGIHLAPVYDGQVRPFLLQDSHGTVALYLLPFLKPAQLRRVFPDAELDSYTDALRTAIAAMNLDPQARNVLVTHQFVTGATRSESEEISVGGTDNVDASVFDPFDYVALGHLHSPQTVGRETLRYCGTPLKYAFSETKEKSVTVVELGEKGDTKVRTLPLTPLRAMVELRGCYEELTRRSFYEHTNYQEDYVHITLTDEMDIPEAMGKLRTIYHKLMKLSYDNGRTRAAASTQTGEREPPASPLALLEEFYQAQNGASLSPEQRRFAQSLMEEIWEGLS
ncbi:MAG: exonuclease SbcCD subunit D [Ruminiclostridium sp.]|jgi:exonuclease SbcD|nr:exonuclease SbcCD subunit D [Ruminiclostridium sp.]